MSAAVPNDMTEERWMREAVAIGPGWMPGLVRCVGTDGDEPSFGWTKKSFGIFEGNCPTDAGLFELSSLTHLGTGLRIGLFNLPEYAATAAELAERVGDWSEIKDGGIITPQWQSAAKQMYGLWQSAGLQCGPLTAQGKGVWCGLEPARKGQQ